MNRLFKLLMVRVRVRVKWVFWMDEKMNGWVFLMNFLDEVCCMDGYTDVLDS